MRIAVVAASLVGLGLLVFLYLQLPTLGAAALLQPVRRVTDAAAPAACVDEMFEGAAVELAGWRCIASSPRRGTIVYLHGVADNRASAIGVIQRFLKRGFDVVAYDSRAHGDSGGAVCTYGYFEKEDLDAVIYTLEPGPIALMGTSLGAAVALQHAARDPRVTTVVAAEVFSDLRTVVGERAPFVVPSTAIEQAFALAEQRARFQVDAVSPLRAAAQITIPVLLLHGAADRDTPPAHSQRVYEALRGPKRLILVPGAPHNGSLAGDVWIEIERWLDNLLPEPRSDLAFPPAAATTAR